VIARTEAFAASQEAVDAYRKLAGMDRAAHLSGLAVWAGGHSMRLAQMGRRA